MYLPSHFEEKDLGELHGAIEAWPLGTLVTVSESGIEANHLPFELDRNLGEYGTLLCHVARANDVWRNAESLATESLVIFQGPSTYISPSLYQTKEETHQVVPTYNYVAVHARGRIIVHDDARWLKGLVGRLTRRFESTRDEPWKMSDAPRTFIAGQLAHIVGLEIRISGLQGKWKLSQNRVEADQQSVVAALTASDRESDSSVGRLMVERKLKSIPRSAATDTSDQ